MFVLGRLEEEVGDGGEEEGTDTYEAEFAFSWENKWFSWNF